MIDVIILKQNRTYTQLLWRDCSNKIPLKYTRTYHRHTQAYSTHTSWLAVCLDLHPASLILRPLSVTWLLYCGFVLCQETGLVFRAIVSSSFRARWTSLTLSLLQRKLRLRERFSLKLTQSEILPSFGMDVKAYGQWEVSMEKRIHDATTR